MITFSAKVVDPQGKHDVQVVPGTYPFRDRHSPMYATLDASGLFPKAEEVLTQPMVPPPHYTRIETWRDVVEYLVANGAYTVAYHIPRQFSADGIRVDRTRIHPFEKCIAESTWNFNFISTRKQFCFKTLIFHIAEYDNAYAVWTTRPTTHLHRHATFVDGEVKKADRIFNTEAYVLADTCVFATSKPIVTIQDGNRLTLKHGMVLENEDSVYRYSLDNIYTLFTANGMWNKVRYKPCTDSGGDGGGIVSRAFTAVDASSNLMLVYIQPSSGTAQ